MTVPMPRSRCSSSSSPEVASVIDGGRLGLEPEQVSRCPSVTTSTAGVKANPRAACGRPLTRRLERDQGWVRITSPARSPCARPACQQHACRGPPLTVGAGGATQSYVAWEHPYIEWPCDRCEEQRRVEPVAASGGRHILYLCHHCRPEQAAEDEAFEELLEAHRVEQVDKARQETVDELADYAEEFAEGFAEFLLLDREMTGGSSMNGGITPLEALLTDTSPATLFAADGDTIEGTSDVRDRLRADATNYEHGESRLEVLQSACGGQIGWWTGFEVWTVQLSGSDDEIELRHRVTEAFRFENDAWKLVHRHVDDRVNSSR